MDFKVDYEKVDSIGENVGIESETLEDKRKKLLDIVDKLQYCWQGDDYNEFKENATAYIKNLKFKVDEIQYISDFMRHASSKYSKNDDKWSERMKKFREEHKWEILEK